jgi:heme-degrading monooxygenase HmoA
MDRSAPSKVHRLLGRELSDASHPQKGHSNMIAVIFESWPAPGKAQDYLNMGAALAAHLESLDGFISIERFQSVVDPGKLLALSFWRDEAAVENWRKKEIHRTVQANSRRTVFKDYRLRVAVVQRDYGMFDRSQAPADSRAAHDGALE